MQRTANLELPIFEQNDRPTWLVDVNDAMRKIDTGYGENVGQAGQAIAIANEAKTTAESAATSATNAVQTATAANTTANGALTAANRADLNASNAYTTAQAAQTAAGNAVTAAAGAQSTADSAVNAAAAAQSTADAANTTASAAQTAAAQAATDAGTAQTAASAAQASATTAQNQAQAAASSASAAQAAATASAGRINNMSTQKRAFIISKPYGKNSWTYYDLMTELRGMLFSGSDSSGYTINVGNGPQNGVAKICDIVLNIMDNDNAPDSIYGRIYHLMDFSIGTDAPYVRLGYTRPNGSTICYGFDEMVIRPYQSDGVSFKRVNITYINNAVGYNYTETDGTDFDVYADDVYVEIEFMNYPSA